MRKSVVLKKKLQKNIRRARKAVGMTQEDVAYKVGISRAYMGYIEQGRNTPSLEILQKIARALKVPASRLLD